MQHRSRKRFYKNVTTRAVGDGWIVLLDDKPIKTPARADLKLPTQALAMSIAEEWRGQGETLSLLSMQHTQLANTAIDRVPKLRAVIIDEVIKYADTDLVCYRAEGPPTLVERQHAHWQPVVDWLVERYGVRLATTHSITPIPQAQHAIAVLRSAIDRYDDFALAGLSASVAAAGSLALGLALAEGFLDGAAAFAAAQVDELFQIEKWGADAEAEARLERVRAELAALAKYHAFLRG